jgi:hypothetical protein
MQGQKATQLGGSPPETIAGLLIRELAGECRDGAYSAAVPQMPATN